MLSFSSQLYTTQMHFILGFNVHLNKAGRNEFTENRIWPEASEMPKFCYVPYFYLWYVH